MTEIPAWLPDLSVFPHQAVLDTNIFNRFSFSDPLLLDFCECTDVYVSEHQIRELENTRNEQIRKSLVKVFTLFSPIEIGSLDSFGASEGPFGVPVTRDTFFKELENIQNSRGNYADAETATLALMLDIPLVTEDENLSRVFLERGGRCFSLLDSTTLSPPSSPTEYPSEYP